MATISKLEFYLLILKPTTALSATVSADPTDPYMALSYTGGQTGTVTAVGTAGAPVPGNTVVVADSGGVERGRTRLRSWSPSNPTGTAGSLSIAETDDLGPYIASGDSLQVLLEWRLWPITPRLVQNGTQATFYEDYDITWNRQTVDWWPVAVAGPPAVVFLSGGTAQAQFVGSYSKALAPGATITGWLWTAHGSNELTSASQGTVGSPVTFTYTAAGQYLVSLRATDSNAKLHTAYTWVFVVNPANPTNAYTQFDAYSDSHDFNRGGGECSFTVHGVADVSQFPRDALVIMACRGSQTTPTGTWPNRENVLFVGYIVGNSIRQDSLHNTTSFRALTIDGLTKNLSMHAVSLRDEKGPANWAMAADITLDRAASFLAIWRSTLASMTPVIFMDYSAEIKRQDFSPTNLYPQLQNELIKDGWGQVVASQQGVLHLARDYNLMTAAERLAVITRKLLHKGIWLDPLDVEERTEYEQPVRKVKMSGIRYPGNQAQPIPLFSEAPGDVQKAFGREEAPGRLILTTQADLNTRCGHALARQNYRWPVVRGRFVNDASFTVAPQEIFPAVIESGDNNRGLAWSPNLVPRRIRRTFNFEGGYYISEVEFEPDVTGPAGVTVIMPVQPPTNPTLPTWDPPPIPEWTPPITPQAGAAVAADQGMGVYWTLTKGATWERRVNGLGTGATGTSQLIFYDLIWDPWWFTPDKKGSSDPEQAILWGCGPGFLVRSEDAGKNWGDLTLNLGDPPNSWSDSPPPTGTAVVNLQIHADIHNIDTFYLLRTWQNASGAWRGWIAKTGDDGITWTHARLSTVAIIDGYLYPQSVVATSGAKVEDASNVLRSDNAFMHFNNVSPATNEWLRVDMGMVVPGFGTATVEWRAKHSGGVSSESRINPDNTAGGPASVHWFDIADPNDGSIYTGSELWNPGADDNEIRVQHAGMGGLPPPTSHGYLDYIRFIWDDLTAPQLRPLAMDLDTQAGSRLYITAWDGTNIWLLVLDSDLVLQRTYDLGLASDAQITTRQAFAVPRSPHLPGAVANYGDYVYLFGAMPSGTFTHLGLSTDAGATFIGKGDASWLASERVGGFLLEEPAGSTLYAFLDGALELWRSQNTGTSWGLINSIPFPVEFETLSKHWGTGADILIGASTPQDSYAGAWLNAPYTDAWFSATGPAGQRLPLIVDGAGGIASIIWI